MYGRYNLYDDGCLSWSEDGCSSCCLSSRDSDDWGCCCEETLTGVTAEGCVLEGYDCHLEEERRLS